MSPDAVLKKEANFAKKKVVPVGDDAPITINVSTYMRINKVRLNSYLPY